MNIIVPWTFPYTTNVTGLTLENQIAWKTASLISRKCTYELRCNGLEFCSRRISCFHAFWCFSWPILAIFHIANVFLSGYVYVDRFTIIASFPTLYVVSKSGWVLAHTKPTVSSCSAFVQPTMQISRPIENRLLLMWPEWVGTMTWLTMWRGSSLDLEVSWSSAVVHNSQ